MKFFMAYFVKPSEKLKNFVRKIKILSEKLKLNFESNFKELLQYIHKKNIWEK
jgi:hypothetical protein